MFDIGFWELCLVWLVSLLVIGPDKLPKAVRVAGFWVGKISSKVAAVKAQMQQELQAEEMRQLLAEKTDSEAIKSLLEEGSEAANEITASIKSLAGKQVTKTNKST